MWLSFGPRTPDVGTLVVKEDMVPNLGATPLFPFTESILVVRMNALPRGFHFPRETVDEQPEPATGVDVN
jgi:hypothetical protein